uniref:SFR19-like C-terminal domain-containing protein n=4 Tax=Lygus hesperus TaxID=30085 RepID=A0A0K8SPB2_LYGHE
MQVKDKFLKKLNRQERVVEEVKMVLKPHYAKKHVTKEEYKEILRKSVPKICHSRSGEINPMKIQRLIEAYVKKYRHKTKKRGGASAIPPLRQNKGKTLWC